MGTISRPRGPYRNGIEQRRRILQGAVTSFGRRGFAGASLRQIAADVGVSHASLVQHFGTKEKLLLAVLERWDEDIRSTVTDVHGIAFLRALGDLVRGHSRRRPYIELFLTMAVEACDPTHPAHHFIRARAERVRAVLLTELRDAVSAGELVLHDEHQLERSVRELIAMMNGLEMQWLLDPTTDLSGIFEEYLERWLKQLGAA